MFGKRLRSALVVGVITASALVAAPLTVGAAAGAETSSDVAPDTSTLVQTGDPVRASDVEPDAEYGDDTTPVSESAAKSSRNEADAPASMTSKFQQIYVVVLNTTPGTAADNLPESEFTDTAIQTTISNLDAYWSNETKGAISTSLATVSGAPAISRLKLADTNTYCNQTTAVASVETSAFGGIFKNNASLGTNKHLLVLTKEGWIYQKQQGCARANATLPNPGYAGGTIFTPEGAGPGGFQTIVHEFGHNMSFQHANASICKNTGSLDGALPTFTLTESVGGVSTPSGVACPTEEYGDYLDIMGRRTINPSHTSSPQLIGLGYWKQNTDYKSVGYTTATTTVNVMPLGNASGIRSVRILDPKSGWYYYVEYRTGTGIDGNSAEYTADTYCEGPYDGYQICSRDSDPAVGTLRILRGYPFNAWQGSSVMAVGTRADSANKLKRDTHLDVGQVFKNHQNGFRLTVNSISPTAGAKISIAFVGDPTYSTIGVNNNASQTFGGTPTVTATAQVAKVLGSYPAGKMLFYVDGKLTKSLATNGSGSASVALSNGLSGGKRTVSAVFAPNDPWLRKSTPVARDVTVKSATSTTSITLKASTVKKKKKLGATLLVKAPGVAAPTGKVYVYAGTKKLGTYALSSSKKGKLSIVLPKFKKKGSFVITAKFAGNSSITSSVSAKKPLRVK
jgi:hypothetical protein